MARRQSPADPAAVLAALAREDVDAVARLLAPLGLSPGDWIHVPGLRTFLEMVAVYRIAGTLDGPRADALREAVARLGIEDTGKGSEPHESFERLRAYWKAAASRSGKVFSAADEDVA